MNVISLKKINDFRKRFADSREALLSWYHEASASDWKTPQDIKDRYRYASFIGDNMVIFNIKGKKYRLVTNVSYTYKTVFIKWIGTHAEYNKKNFAGGK